MVDRKNESIDGWDHIRFKPSESQLEELPTLERIIVSNEILLESHEKTMPYQPSEGEVAVFGVYRGNGVWEATDVEDITKYADEATPGGIFGSWLPLEMIKKYHSLGKRLVAQFHSHPPSGAYVSDTDRNTEKERERSGSKVLLASITPEYIVTFFGNPNYEVQGGARKIGVYKAFGKEYAQYQIAVGKGAMPVIKDVKDMDPQEAAKLIRFAPLNETDIEEQASQITFSPMDIEEQADQIEFEDIE